MTSTVVPSAPPVNRQPSGSPAGPRQIERRLFGWCCSAVPVPILIWAGTDETAEYVATHYFERAGEPKSIWNIPESEHTGGLQARPAEYERRVIGFFDDALLR